MNEKRNIVDNSCSKRVMASYLGVSVTALKRRDVHHIDCNPNNNYIRNLISLNKDLHALIHTKLVKGIRPIQKVYLAAPIDGVTEDIAQSWRTKAYDYLAQNAILSLVPGKETRGLLTPPEIVDLDTCMIKNADAILVNLNFLVNPKLGRGSGTLAELGMAIAYGDKPIIAFVEGDLGDNKFVKGMCSHILSTLEEALEVLVNINCL